MRSHRSWRRDDQEPRRLHEMRGFFTGRFDPAGRRLHPRRRFLLFWIAGFFGFLSLLALLGIGLLSLAFTRVFGGSSQAAVSTWVTACGLAIALPMLAGGAAVWTFRRFGSPLANVMEAADAVAGGDLSVRVPEAGTREFARLAQSFNHMANELQRADQQRRNLTADVAHELRTPLQIIQGNLEGVIDGVYQPTNDHLKATLDETRLLARLVDDLQTLSLAEAGQLPLKWEAVDVNGLLEDVVTSFSGQAEAAGVELRLKPGEPPEAMTITADAGRLDQILGNLVANALRYTPSGGSITLHAEAVEGGVRLRVSDTGEGIAPDNLPYIFDRFWRGDRSRAHTGGAASGLGLAITRQLVRAHNGQIEVQSELGRGTIFTIELPAHSPV